MEAQQTNTSVSLLSSMNAFYGIPNTSQETTAAIERGAKAPEVYTSPEPEPVQEPTINAENPVPANQTEDFFAQTSERVEISDQAAAMQQQGNESPAAQALYGASDNMPLEAQAPTAESGAGAQVQTQDLGQSPETNPAPQALNSEPAATSTLNEPQTPETQSNSSNNPQPANNPLQQGYAGGGAAASIASQPGAIFSAMG